MRTITISSGTRRDGKLVTRELVTCEAEEACNSPAMRVGNQGCFLHNDDPAVVSKREAGLRKQRAAASDRKGKTHAQWLTEQGKEP